VCKMITSLTLPEVPMTSRETAAAAAMNRAANTEWGRHFKTCPRCRKLAPVCAKGTALWNLKVAASRNLAENRAADAKPMPGEVTLW